VRITIDIDTSQITADDRRVLMALAGHDAGELRVTRLDDAATTPQPATPAPPLPVPVPPDFAAKLGDAVAQFSPRGSGSEARLPFAQQAGVRTSSTMPDDDEPHAGEHRVFGVDVLDDTATVVTGAVRDGVVHISEPVQVPRELVEEDADVPHPQDRVRSAILGVVEQPPVRHTSP
jgi:hypothetical protein